MPFEPNVPPPTGWAPKCSGLTYTQLRLIGEVVTHWAVLEIAIQQMLFVMAQSPEYLGQALTEDLGPDHRLKALKRLCRHWQKFLRPNPPKDNTLELIADAQACISWITKNKDKRNRVAHWWWSRATDDLMYCYKYTMKRHAADEGEEIGNHMSVENSELEEFANEISEKATHMLGLLKLFEMRLPAWPRKRG